ncbi:MAG TPA: DUF5666 domain-containing protein [Candidatus Eisenbacteria bacterium]
MRTPRTLSMNVLLSLAGLGLSLGLLLGGCGGSGGAAGPVGGGTSAGTNGFSQGVITAFGTIHMGSGADERVFHVEGARLKRLDDGIEHDGLNDDNVVFRVGMKVEVFHAADSSRATEVHYMNDLEGPITAKPSATAGATFDVLGVPVLVDANTHFDDSFESSGLTLGTLVVGNDIEVSGLYDANGILHATFIEGRHASSAGRTFEIKGKISNLGGVAPNQTFKLNGVSFSMNASTDLHDLLVGLSEGMFVEVKTQSTSAPFVVTRIEGLSGDFDAPENEVRRADDASVEGFVTNLSGTSPNFTFTLGGTKVTTSSATTIGLGLVVANAHIEAEGSVGTLGEIKATKIFARQ